MKIATVAGLHHCAQDLKGCVRFGSLLYHGTEVLSLDRHRLLVPFSAFLGVDRG